MKKFSLKKFIFVIIVLAVFTMPALVTYALMERSDEAEKKAERLIELQNNSAYTLSHSTGSDALRAITTECTTLPAEPEELEMTVLDQNKLTYSDSVETSTDADAIEISDSLAAADNAGEEAEGSVGSNVAGDADAASVTDATAGDAEVPLNGRKVYLTFDDGPSDYTDELLDILAKYDVKATFFVVVNNYEYKSQLNRILDEGHTLGLHSKSHVYSKIYADYESFVRDVFEVHNWVYKLTGYDSRYYRFPGGSSNNVTNVSIADCVDYLHRNGYEFYDWNSESRDAENLYLTPEQLNANVMDYVRNSDGNVTVLMHDLDDHYNTILALPSLIETLKSEGFELCPIDESTKPVQHYIPQD